MPKLTSTEQLDPSQSVETISLFVSVTQHVECEQMVQYHVNVSIADAVNASRVVPLANSVVTFTNIPRGLYNCTITVWREEVRIETTSLSCTSRGEQYSA